MIKNICNVLLIVISIFILIFVVDGANNTSSIYNNHNTTVSENGTSDVNVNKTIISNVERVNNTESHKSKVSIKIYRTPKKTSGFDIALIAPIIVIIYYLRIKKR